MNDPELAVEIAQEHEAFLTQLEGLAVEAIATKNWDAFYSHVVDFQNEHDFHGETVIAIEGEYVKPLDTKNHNEHTD